MQIPIPEQIKKYVEDIEIVPLIEIKGTKWYIVSKEELKELVKYRDEIDKIPEKVWRAYPKEDIEHDCDCGNNADRIIRNCVVKDNNPDGYKVINRTYISSLF